jgi:hypothetical protein
MVSPDSDGFTFGQANVGQILGVAIVALNDCGLAWYSSAMICTSALGTRTRSDTHITPARGPPRKDFDDAEFGVSSQGTWSFCRENTEEEMIWVRKTAGRDEGTIAM